jgi:Rps23 Pro-64 3,4-dihydroxylase Tpa1-like proline 4-hydroxylase
MQQTLLLWPTKIEVIDNFVEDNQIIDNLKKESIIDTVISGQDTTNMSWAQSELMSMVEKSVMTYCVDIDIDYNSLELNDMQKGCLYPYNEHMVGNHLYEPHHDIAENGFITALYYVDSDWTENEWVGGELCIYKHLTFSDYPENTVNILPKQNRLIIFPGYLVHRVKPYFGKNPRTSMVMGWRVKEPTNKTVIVI